MKINIAKSLIVILSALMVSACGLNLSRQASSFQCNKITESDERARCYDSTDKFNDALREKIEKEKQAEKAKQQLDFTPNKEPAIAEDSGLD
jgi:uncharacterized protein